MLRRVGGPSPSHRALAMCFTVRLIARPMSFTGRRRFNFWLVA